MTRFPLSLRPFLTPRVAPVVARRALEALQRDDAAEAAAGPGWFESSWDLSHGLEVDEGRPGDDRYDLWLEARELAERRAAAQRAARSARKVAPRRAPEDDLPDLGDLDRTAFAAARAPAAAPDDFSRFDIGGLSLA